MTIKNSISDTILHRLEKKSISTKVGLLNGLAGESLYYFYRSELFDEDESYEKAVAKLQEVIEVIRSDTSHSTFHNGIAGIGWMILHLNETALVEIAIEDVFDHSIDQFLYEDMIKHLDRNIYDFFFGASGICYYFLYRYRTTSDTYLKETYKNHITHFLFYLEYFGIQDENGMYWKHHQYPFEDDGISFQLSSERNISAVMMILTEIINLNDFNPIAISLLQKSSRWLLHQIETSTNSVQIDQAFCLWKAGNTLNENYITTKSFQLLKETIFDVSKQNTASLCKYALVYQRIAQQTQNQFFFEKATKYFQKVTSRYANNNTIDRSIWKGNAGIGLTDFVFTNTLDMEWATCMLI